MRILALLLALAVTACVEGEDPMTLSNTVYGLEAVGVLKGSGGALAVKGRGFTAARLGAGQYRVTLERAIDLTPGLTAEGAITFGMVTPDRTAAISVVSPTVFDVLTRSMAAGGTSIAPAPGAWFQSNIAANQNQVAMEATGGAGATSYRADRAGSVVGISAQLSELLTAGTLNITFTVNGVLKGGIGAALSPPGALGDQSTYAEGVWPFVAGDLLGFVITTDAGFAPITADVTAWMTLAYSGGTPAAAADADVMFSVTRFSP